MSLDPSNSSGTNYNIGVTTNTGSSVEDLTRVTTELERMQAVAATPVKPITVSPATGGKSKTPAQASADDTKKAGEEEKKALDQSQVRFVDYFQTRKEYAAKFNAAQEEARQRERQKEEDFGKLTLQDQLKILQERKWAKDRWNAQRLAEQRKIEAEMAAIEASEGTTGSGKATKAAETERALRKQEAALKDVATATESVGTANTSAGTKAETAVRSFVTVANAARGGIAAMGPSLTSLTLAFGGGAGLAGGIGLATELLGVFYTELKKGGIIAQEFQVDVDAYVEKAVLKLETRLKQATTKLDQQFRVSEITNATNLAKRQTDDQEFSVSQQSQSALIGILQRQRDLTGQIDNIQRDSAVREQEINRQREQALATAKKGIDDQIRDEKELLDAKQREYEHEVDLYTQVEKRREAAKQAVKEAEAWVARIAQLKADAKEVENDPYSIADTDFHPTSKAIDAQNQLLNEDPNAADAGLARARAELAKITAETRKFADDTNNNAGALLDAAYKVAEASKALTDDQAETSRKMALATQQANEEAIRAKQELVASVNNEIIPKIQEIAKLAEGQGGRVGEAVSKLESYVADGKLTVDELDKIPAKLATIIAQFAGNKQQLLVVSEGLASVAQDQEARIQRLTFEVQNLQRTVQAQAARLTAPAR